MATEINQAKLVKLVKSGKTQAECAAELGVTPGQLGMLKFGLALVETGKLKKAPATAASVKALRKQGVRWEFIAAMTGLSVAAAKEHDDGTQIARGRKAEGETSTGRAKPASRSSKPAGRKPAGRSKPTGRKPGRARTRAERAARSGNPS